MFVSLSMSLLIFFFSQIFKTKFTGWDEVIAVDFTRTAESVQRTGADLVKWAKQKETKAELAALFTPRQPAMSASEAQQLMDEWNDDLDSMDSFVLEGRKFVRLPSEELGKINSENLTIKILSSPIFRNFFLILYDNFPMML